MNAFRSATPTSAFTLIELLVVMTVLAILMGMMMPMLGLAQRAAKRSASLSVMHKADAALRLFRGEMGVYPYQFSYADVDAGEVPANRLHYHLGTLIAPTDLALVYADADSAAAKYDYPLTRLSNGILNEPASFASIHTFRQNDAIAGMRQDMSGIGGYGIARFGPMGTAVLLNRLAKERARLAVFSGNPLVKGLKLPDQLNTATLQPIANSARNAPTATTPLIATPVSSGCPGWANDYLDGELEARYIAGEAILDAYKRPLVYICQVQEGVRPPRSPAMLDDFCTTIDRQAYGLVTKGRTALASTLADDPVGLPDHTNLRHSDRRLYAAAGFEREFELWSTGPDGKLGWMRDDPRNRDNLPLVNYDRSIP